MKKIKISVIGEDGKVEDVEVEKGTKISIEVAIVDSDTNGNLSLPIVEVPESIFVGERKANPRVCLSSFLKISKELKIA